MTSSFFIYGYPDGKAVRRRSRTQRCVECKASKSPSWRLGANGVRLCNKCGLKYKRRALKRGPALSTSPSPPSPGPSSESLNAAACVPSAPAGYPDTHPLPRPPTSTSTLRPIIVAAELQNIPPCEVESTVCPSSDSSSNGSSIGNEELGDNRDSWEYAPHSQENWGCSNTDEWPLNLPPVVPPVQVPDSCGAGIEVAQYASQSNCVFNNIIQDDWAVDTTALSESQHQATETENHANLPVSSSSQSAGIDNTMFSEMQLSTSERLSGGGVDSLRLSTFDASDVLPASSSSSSLSLSALFDGRLRGSTFSPDHPSFQLSSWLAYCEQPSILKNGYSHSLDQARQEATWQASDHLQLSSFFAPEVAGPACIATDNANGVQCKCSVCLKGLFVGSNETVFMGPQDYLQMSLNMFYRRAAATHIEALQRGSSIYVATETFICATAGDHRLVTAFVVLRQELELVDSHSRHYPALMALGCDLVFDFVVNGTASYPTPLDDWLHGQALTKHLLSERAKSAIWDMSRLPPGPHRQDSTTFRWLQRSLLTLETSTGPQTVMNVQSGSDKHEFRRLHGVFALIKHINTPNRLDFYVSLEPRVLDACIKSCQEWFIAVLDEAAKISSHETQLEFLEANKLYMLECIEVYMLTFHGMNIYRCLHLCPADCTSHVQPSFKSLFDAAGDALQSLFSPPEGLSRYIQESPPTYPTRDQLFHTRIIGLTQFKLYFSYLLLSKEEKTRHSKVSRAGLARARLALAERSHIMLVWNYLPVDIAQRAAVKLAHATQTLMSAPTVSVV